MDFKIRENLIAWERTYNDPKYFEEDPIAFPRIFAARFKGGKASLQDVETAAVFAAHFAWGRRAMIVRDCNRFFDFMQWEPASYVFSGQWKDSQESIHRTVKWADTARICASLREIFRVDGTLEGLGTEGIRRHVFGQKDDPKAANKKINMMRRWMVRRDGLVDLGLWTHTDPSELIMPLDVHVYDEAVVLGLTSRKPKDITTALEITDAFREIWPDDPCRGDFALFGYGVSKEQ